ncbi:MAG TPA: hypothetical protein VFA30_10965 [Gaiellaceae bacterium]|nr:hypothetical protein [Gaiellaceae bacterium]
MNRRKLELSTVAAATLALFAAVAVSTATATTSPTNYKIFNVRLTDHGVVFKPKARLEVGEVGLFRITNDSKTSRVFEVSIRATHRLQTSGKEAFYELFPQLGKVKWVSHAAKGKTFTGFIQVVPCKDTSGTSLCNGTGD